MVSRLSYVGELGWELYIPIKESKKIYEIINNIGKNFNMVHAGRLAMDIMRMEKGYLHWGHDISPAENPYESGLDFAVKENKDFEFLGKKSLLNNKSNQKKQLAMFILIDSNPGNPLLLHDEPIYYKENIIGETTSGNYSFCYNKNMAFGYIDSKINKNDMKNEIFQIEVSKVKYDAKLLLLPLHDPKNSKIKS